MEIRKPLRIIPNSLSLPKVSPIIKKPSSKISQSSQVPISSKDTFIKSSVELRDPGKTSTRELRKTKEINETGASSTEIPLNPYEYAKKYKTGFFINHGPHDPFDAFRLAKLSAERDISFEVDGFKGEINGKEVFVNAHPPVFYKMNGEPFPSADNLDRISPYKYIEVLRNSKAPVKFDFKSEKAIDEMAKLAKLIPKERRMGHMFLWELTPKEYMDKVKNPYRRKLIQYENFTLEQMLEAKRKLGNVPFVVSARGMTKAKVTDKEFLDYVGRTLKGKAEIVEFNLPGNEPPPPETVKYLWEKYGIMCEVKIRSLEEKVFWLEFARREKVPFIGLVDDPSLATPAGKHPEDEYRDTISKLNGLNPASSTGDTPEGFLISDNAKRR